MESLRALARTLDIPERTLRRAAEEGLLRGERISPRRFRVSLREEDYLRRNWPLLRDLRAALRTEPSVRLAVLFGSHARGTATARSDVDLLVEIAPDEIAQLTDVSGRLSARLDRDVQLVRVADAHKSPALIRAVAEHGRVLVDRERRWPALAPTLARVRPREEPPLDELMEDLPRDTLRR